MKAKNIEDVKKDIEQEETMKTEKEQVFKDRPITDEEWNDVLKSREEKANNSTALATKPENKVKSVTKTVLKFAVPGLLFTGAGIFIGKKLGGGKKNSTVGDFIDVPCDNADDDDYDEYDED